MLRRPLSVVRFPDAQVERALPAVADMGGLEADHEGAKFGEPQPQRHLAAQHTALAVVFAASDALAGDHQGEARAVALRSPQEADERGMRLALRHAVQIDA